MTTQTELQNSSERQLNTGERPFQNRVAEIVNTVGRSSFYTEQRRGHIPHSEAFTAAADAILMDPESHLSKSEHALLDVVKNLGGFIEADDAVSRLSETERNGKRLNQNQLFFRKKQKTEHLIPFNHSLKNLIDADPNVSMQTMAGSLAQAYGAVFSKSYVLDGGKPRNAEDILSGRDVLGKLEATINGMRHEIAAETMLSTLGVDYDYDVSVSEDATGTDLFVMIDGKYEAIDIKGSYTAERKAHERRFNSRAVWTGLEQSDFTGVKNNTHNAVSVSYDTAATKAEAFYNRILGVVYQSNNARVR